MFKVKQSTPPPSYGLVGIHHKLVNHWYALEERANKRRKRYWASVDASSSTFEPQGRPGTPLGGEVLFIFF
jgi:hypothetical protein